MAGDSSHNQDRPIRSAGGWTVRYVKALFQLAEENAAVAAIGRDLETMLTALDDSPELHALFSTPAALGRGVEAALESVLVQLKIGTHVRHFIALLVRNRRLADFPEMARGFFDSAAQADGVETWTILSARTLPPRQRRRIEKTLRDRQADRQVEIAYRVDPDLLGGLIWRGAGREIDASLAGKLRRLESRLGG